MTKRFSEVILLTCLIVACAHAAEPTWPANYSLHHGETSSASPDGELGFLVPTGDGYEKGDRVKLVNLKTGAIVHQIDHGEYWFQDGGGLSNGGIVPHWVADPAHKSGWLCVIEFPGKWQPRNVTLIEVGPGAQFVETDIWALVEAASQKHMKGKIPDKSFNENYAFLLTDAEIAWDGTKAVVIKATLDSNPKDLSNEPRWSGPCTSRFDLATRKVTFEPGTIEYRKAEPEPK